MNVVIAVLVCFIPLLVTVLFSRIYNIIIGLFMYPFTCFVWVFLGSKIPAIANLSVVDGKDYNAFNANIVEFIHRYTFDKLTFLDDLSFKPWLVLGIWVLVFIIFFSISAACRRARKRRLQNKYSRVRVVQPRY